MGYNVTLTGTYTLNIEGVEASSLREAQEKVHDEVSAYEAVGNCIAFDFGEVAENEIYLDCSELEVNNN